jgi:hypothetical protein
MLPEEVQGQVREADEGTDTWLALQDPVNNLDDPGKEALEDLPSRPKETSVYVK